MLSGIPPMKQYLLSSSSSSLWMDSVVFAGGDNTTLRPSPARQPKGTRQMPAGEFPDTGPVRPGNEMSFKANSRSEPAAITCSSGISSKK